MKINADILYHRLREYYPVEMMGSGSSKLIYERAELYIDNTDRLRAGHVYLATVEHLPIRPVIEKNVVIVCIGENARLHYYRDHAVILLIRSKQDFFRVYQTLQDIFDIYNRWESEMLQLMMKDPMVSDVVRASAELFRGKLAVLDASFRYIASTEKGDMLPDVRGYGEVKVSPAELGEYLRHWEMNTDRHGAMQFPIGEDISLCVNLFDRSDDYLGCLYILMEGGEYAKGEDALAEQLATILERVLERNPVLVHDGRSIRKEALKRLMDEMPLSNSQRLLLRSSPKDTPYICISMHCMKGQPSVPISYICSVFESITEGNIFFAHNNSIVGLIPVEHMKKEYAESRGEDPAFQKILDDMCLCIGTSNTMTDIYMLRVYYTQAEAAIENGMLFHPDRRIHNFRDYALQEMVINSMGGLPVETYFPDGFRELLEHDREGGVSYVETLQVFLEENMSYAKTARRLFIHRTTLMERLARIEKDLHLNLEDSDQRLQILLLLKARDIENSIRQTEH